MCYLRGVIMLRMNRAQDAKESLMEALAIDCKNVDAFEMLVGGEMMTIDEGALWFGLVGIVSHVFIFLFAEWSFIQGLAYLNSEDEYAGEFVRAIYVIRLRKVSHPPSRHFKFNLINTQIQHSTNTLPKWPPHDIACPLNLACRIM